MAPIKRKTRRKLSKHLARLIKRHGADMTMALVGGIVSSLTEAPAKSPRKAKPQAPRRGAAGDKASRKGD